MVKAGIAKPGSEVVRFIFEAPADLPHGETWAEDQRSQAGVVESVHFETGIDIGSFTWNQAELCNFCIKIGSEVIGFWKKPPITLPTLLASPFPNVLRSVRSISH